VRTRGRPKKGEVRQAAPVQVVAVKKKVPSHRKGGDCSSDEDYNQPKIVTRGKRGRPRRDGDESAASTKPKMKHVDENGNPIVKRRGRPPKDPNNAHKAKQAEAGKNQKPSQDQSPQKKCTISQLED
jgi:hypothetical protein